jgi:hypothetical protein
MLTQQAETVIKDNGAWTNLCRIEENNRKKKRKTSKCKSCDKVESPPPYSQLDSPSYVFLGYKKFFLNIDNL